MAGIQCRRLLEVPAALVVVMAPSGGRGKSCKPTCGQAALGRHWMPSVPGIPQGVPAAAARRPAFAGPGSRWQAAARGARRGRRVSQTMTRRAREPANPPLIRACGARERRGAGKALQDSAHGRIAAIPSVDPGISCRGPRGAPGRAHGPCTGAGGATRLREAKAGVGGGRPARGRGDSHPSRAAPPPRLPRFAVARVPRGRHPGRKAQIPPFHAHINATCAQARRVECGCHEGQPRRAKVGHGQRRLGG